MKKEDWVKRQANSYQSKEGFIFVPLLRGFDEIKPIWELLDLVRGRTNGEIILCGGYARYCASPRQEPFKAGDVDVYCETEDAFMQLKEAIDRELKIEYDNETAITYKRKRKGKLKGCPKLQIIKPVNRGAMVAKGNVETIISNFDFTVVRAAIMSPSEVMVDADFMHDEEHSLIRIKNIHCPISSNLRCMKYAKKGYFLTPSECMKLFADWDKRDDSYRNDLINFLIDVDKSGGFSEDEVDRLEAMMRLD